MKFLKGLRPAREGPQMDGEARARGHERRQTKTAVPTPPPPWAQECVPRVGGDARTLRAVRMTNNDNVEHLRQLEGNEREAHVPKAFDTPPDPPAEGRRWGARPSDEGRRTRLHPLCLVSAS